MKTQLIIMAALALAGSGCALNDALTAEFAGGSGPGPGQPDMSPDGGPDAPPDQCAPCSGACVRIAGGDEVLCQEPDLSLRGDDAEAVIARCFTLIPDDAAEEADVAQVTEAGELVALSREGSVWSIQRVGLAGRALEARAEQLYSEVSVSALAPHDMVVLGQGEQLHVEVLGEVESMGTAPTIATASFSANTPIVTPLLVNTLPQHLCARDTARPLHFTALSTTTAPSQTHFVAAACVCDRPNVLEGCTGSTKVLDWEGIDSAREVTTAPDVNDMRGARRLVGVANGVALSGFLGQQPFIWERAREARVWVEPDRQVFSQPQVVGADHCLAQGQHLGELTPSATPQAHPLRVRSSAPAQTPNLMTFSAPRQGNTRREAVLALTTMPRNVNISNARCLGDEQAPNGVTGIDLAVRDAIQDPGMIQLLMAETRQGGARGIWLRRLQSILDREGASSLRLFVEGYTLTPSRLFKIGNLATITGQAKRGNDTFTFAVRVDNSGALVCRPQ